MKIVAEEVDVDVDVVMEDDAGQQEGEEQREEQRGEEGQREEEPQEENVGGDDPPLQEIEIEIEIEEEHAAVQIDDIQQEETVDKEIHNLHHQERENREPLNGDLREKVITDRKIENKQSLNGDLQEKEIQERDTNAEPSDHTQILPTDNKFLNSDYLLSLNSVLAQKGLEEVLQWCYLSLPGLFQVTSFGSTGMVIIHALSKLNIKIPIIFLNTLYHFPETLAHARQVQLHYSLPVHWYHCKNAATREQFEEVYGSRQMWIEEPQKYEMLTKVEPLERALREKNVSAWITGRRRDQGGMRKEIPILEVDPVDGRIKVNPLAYWTNQEIWTYIRQEGLPYNPLFDQSYTSIGDSVTTKKNDDPLLGERSNRFYQFEGKTECGIHNRRRPNPNANTNTIV